MDGGAGVSEHLDPDKLAMYQLALKKVKQLGYPVTKDRIWDQYVALSMGSGIPSLLSKHKSDLYLREIGVQS